MLVFVMVLSSVPAYASMDGTEEPAPVISEETTVSENVDSSATESTQSMAESEESAPPVTVPVER